MKKIAILVTILLFLLLIWQCGNNGDTMTGQKQPMKKAAAVDKAVISKVTDALIKKHGDENAERIKRGVRHAAGLWRQSDGSSEAFETFCLDHFIAAEEERELVFKKLSRNFEVILGHFNKIELDLKAPLHLDAGEIHPIDQIFGGCDVGSHLDEDFYRNKIAFIVALNFPYYSLDEKKKLGRDWSRKEWAYARLGDFYISRVPAELKQKYSEVNSNARVYISQYNIYAGKLVNDKGEKLFPKDLILLSHWNLRDELIANYGTARGMEKQRMIYEVMKRIISQEIPQQVINSNQWDWNPYQNKVFKDGEVVELKPEPNTRYQHILNSFRALKAADAYYPPSMDTFIKRKFAGEMEIPQPEVEALFIKFISSPQVKKTAQLIRSRLKRDLEPFDIWYDGFTARSGISEEKLNAITRKKYPTAKALETDLTNILLKLGFSREKADFLASKIVVEAARGSGHAWGPEMKAEKAHLRTRVPTDGMNYKGYVIAVHEFGHNVEQIVSLNDVDYYMMQGVPNTAFTEALAYIFQKQNLDLLGIKETNPDKDYLKALETCWNAYEIMGVSLLDMRTWKWMYEHPEANVQQLKEAVIRIAKDIWNNYYADVFGGVKDQPILAVYSHMIHYPLYLTGYAYGELIKFQIEQHLESKDFAAEVERMFSAGRLTPNLWMKNAAGKEIAIEPILQATDEALKHIK
ncbi:MAG: hypothetical protein GTO45_12850 [Candidatus Aminicenantes bacterium]|nr:hypothetical protein [Candidatus Aminicenantes bacterium]NIM79673.1 hypothetical protein [Candidatus Aminicenantes bacterium]NIN18999.1 hypothetical protein [Candidatus Aminicenantes bacterium]NIN42901.1 hypothetical protein [Candidatus Aminicenantes bacterium]NIN85638.1 hypothetical protein [Candidatus Aminicenantes bacterium]